jgi:hypothetical protein
MRAYVQWMGLTLAERRAITEAAATRYQLASRRGRTRILDELRGQYGVAPKPRAQSARSGAAAQYRRPAQSAAGEVRARGYRGADGLLDGNRRHPPQSGGVTGSSRRS